MLAIQSFGQLSSSEIHLGLQKLGVTGTALYLAAHPDDENTRLISYLANEKKLRTGYLSLTRGDGGQNLIGSELGIELGLIRTQELLAARRIDGAEQFFTRAFDFGFSKSPDEAFDIWNKEKILHDAVWVIRKFKPDIIIARFPEDNRAGHGHHWASAIIAREAAIAAADPNKFPEQFQYGLQPWEVTRVLWNTFSFGRTSTISDDQFKIDVGQFNPLLGKGYGEISAESRSQHKSQGFGVPNSYGQAFEYFVTILGTAPEKELTDGVKLSWDALKYPSIAKAVQHLIAEFDHSNPSASVPGLTALYNQLQDARGKETDLRTKHILEQKAKETQNLILQASGIYAEAIADRQFAIPGDTVNIQLGFVNRGNASPTEVHFIHEGKAYPVTELSKKNIFQEIKLKYRIIESPEDTQPYWLKKPKAEGHFNLDNILLTGFPEEPDGRVKLKLSFGNTHLEYPVSLQYKYTDPVKGEIRQKMVYHPAIQIEVKHSVILTGTGRTPLPVVIRVIPADHYGEQELEFKFINGNNQIRIIRKANLRKNIPVEFSFNHHEIYNGKNSVRLVPEVNILNGKSKGYRQSVRIIRYDHIPDISYLKEGEIKLVKEEIKITDSKIAYIPGAGDAVMEALQAMGYQVALIAEADLQPNILKSYDVVITGIRAYNTNSWLLKYYDVLMDYVKNGGSLILQYNTTIPQELIKSSISPFPFFIGRGRATEEDSPVNFLMPSHAVLNFPNKIQQQDFNGWVQERGLYFAQDFGNEFEAPLGMADKNEELQNGSLIIAKYGEGRFVYTGLAFFRQLPAGVPGAYKLLANIIALNKNGK